MSHSLLIHWEPSSETGIPIIDEQHRGIVSIINSFGFAIQRDRKTEFFLNTIFTMIDCYTKLHFATEEEFMRSAGYPEIEDHQRQHAELIKKSFSVASQSIRLRDPEMYLQFLRKWWVTHINTIDRRYAPFLIKHANA